MAIQFDADGVRIPDEKISEGNKSKAKADEQPKDDKAKPASDEKPAKG